MPAKEEEVKKYRDAAIGNAAIVEEQTHTLGPHSPFGLKIPNQSAAGRKFKEATHVYSTSRDVVVFIFSHVS